MLVTFPRLLQASVHQGAAKQQAGEEHGDEGHEELGFLLRGSVASLVLLAHAAGPGSPAQQHLYSLLSSVLKVGQLISGSAAWMHQGGAQ